MKKTFLHIVLQLLLLSGLGMKGYAQLNPCTTFNGGPYNQGVTAAGCDGQDMELFGLAVWQEEVYFADVVSGANYTFYLDGCAEDAWGDPVLITAVMGGTLVADPDGYQGAQTGSIDGGAVQGVAEGCEITFTATETGTCYFILSTTTTCGGPNVQADNGLPHIITNEGLVCDECGNGTCAAGEDYCNCSDDCPCNSLIGPVYIVRNATNDGWIGGDTPSADAIFCSYEMIDLVGAEGEEGFVYMGLGFFGTNCMASTTLDVSSDFGQVVDFALAETASIAEASVQFLKLSQEDIDASGGTITITFVDPNAPANNPCEVNFVINVADLGTHTSLINDICPPVNSECGNGICELGESYCGGCADCTCESLVTIAFIENDGTAFIGVPTLSASAVYCSYEMFDLIGSDGEEGNLYLGVGFFGSSCLAQATLDIEASAGMLVDFSLTETSTIDEATVYFLSLSQSDIDAAGGSITLTYTDNNAPSGEPCSLTQTIDLTTLGAIGTLAETLCPPLNFECGNNVCEQGENYCTCADCDCSSVVTPVFLVFDTSMQQYNGVSDFSEGSVFCEGDLTGQPNPEPNVLYVGLSFFGLSCMIDGTLDVSATQGVLLRFDTNGVATETNVFTDSGVFFLSVNQDDINASGGTTTITYSNPSDPGAGGSCSQSLTINWASLGDVATLVEDFCAPPVPQDNCTQFAGGPYTDQAIDIAPDCNESISAPYAAWLNEIYFTTIVEGNSYTFSICDGYSETAWGAPAQITVIYNDGTATVDTDNGEVTGGQILLAEEGCEVSFDSPGAGEVYFILSTALDCGGALLNTNNGIPTVTTTCGIGVENNTSAQYGLSVSPIPATNSIQVVYNTQNAAEVAINVYDISGKLLATQNEQANGGSNTFGLNIANYAAGVYFLTLTDGQQSTTVKFVKQ